MPSEPEIIKPLIRQVVLKNGNFKIVPDKVGLDAPGFKDIPQPDILIPLIENLDKLWPYEIEPEPRNAGKLIELLRACRFLRSKPYNEIIILPDVDKARNTGAYDTPVPIVKFIVSSILGKFPAYGDPPKVLDPACGAGYFLIKAIDLLVENFNRIKVSDLVSNFIFGFDNDPVAVSLARRNLAWHLGNRHHVVLPAEILKKTIVNLDALADYKTLKHKPGSFDCVIGNPPYRFYSGKGSPVAALEKAGRSATADKLKQQIDKYIQRFPDSSHGCRDLYKWFIERAIDLTTPNGYVGLITPNTWLAYPRYRDIRSLMADRGTIEAVVDFGSLVFSRAQVPTSVLFWRRGNSVDPDFPVAHLTKLDWDKVTAGNQDVFFSSIHAGKRHRLDDYHDLVAATGPASKVKDRDLVRSLYQIPDAPHRIKLGKVAILREGSHSIPAVDDDVSTVASKRKKLPIIMDKTMGDLVMPEIGYIATPSKLDKSTHHAGQRFFIRKTGDRITVAPSPSDGFALAHQNIYVGKLVSKSITFNALIGILSSDLMTSLYRNGPGGQTGRTHAQLRIHFLRDLPIIVRPDLPGCDMEISTAEVTHALQKAILGVYSQFEPIDGEFPSDHKTAMTVFRRIALYHGVIGKLVEFITLEKRIELKGVLDKLVARLYGVHDLK